MKFLTRVLTTTCYIFTSIMVLGFIFQQPLLNQLEWYDFSFNKLFLTTISFDLFTIALLTSFITVFIDQIAELSEKWKNVLSYSGTLIVVLLFSYAKGYIDFSFHYLIAVSIIVLICYGIVWCILLIQSFKLAEEINHSLKKINH